MWSKKGKRIAASVIAIILAFAMVVPMFLEMIV